VEDLLARDYDYWALGHVHQREILRCDPWIVFPGNTQGRHIRESGPKGCTLVTLEGNRRISVEECDLHTAEWALCEVSAAEAGSPEEAVALVPGAVEARRREARAPLLAARVVIRGASPAHAGLTGAPGKWISELRAAVADASSGGAWIEKVVFDTRSPVRIEDLVRRGDPEGEFMRLLQEATPDETSAAGLSDDILPLRSKLPAELFEGPDRLDLESPESRRALLLKARDTLLGRLLESGGGP
jgi:DNA repair exonuclease SbcCD nuclease subunit